VESSSSVRIMGVYATRWRYTGETAGTRVTSEDLGDGLANYYRRIEDEEPYELPDVLSRSTATITFGPPDLPESIAGVTTAEVLLFALPFPADQVVVALIVDFWSPDLNVDATLAQRVLESCQEASVCVDGINLPAYVDALGKRQDVAAFELPGAKPRTGLPLERHHLILLREPWPYEAPRDDVVRRLMFGSRLRFTGLLEPAGLNQGTAYGAVTSSASLLCGHAEEVEYSVFLTIVQAVGTASRFQQIWQDAYHQVQEFQDNKQEKLPGVQQRKDLETLADHMGNLELDLAFSVQTAADLGLNPSTRIDTFHEDLYKAMQIRARASTVSLMFDRLGGSIRSELTAIESRERQEEEARRQLDDERRRNGTFALSVLTCIIAPITFLLGFFGMNVSEVHPGADLWNWHLFLPVYIIAALLGIAPIVTFFILQFLANRRRRPATARSTEVPDAPGKKAQELAQPGPS
jgi:hypothetical protein